MTFMTEAASGGVREGGATPLSSHVEGSTDIALMMEAAPGSVI